MVHWTTHQSPRYSAAFVKGGQQQEARSEDMDTKSVKEHLVNVFSLLAVEEPCPTPLGSKSTQKKKPDPTLIPTLEDDGMGSDFALWCHLKDLDDVRDFLKQAWLQYAEGVLSVVLVSQLTEVGLGLMRLEEEKFTVKYPQFKDYWAILTYLGLDVQGSGKTM